MSFDHGDRITDDNGAETWIARQHHDWQREGSPTGVFAPGALPLVDRGRTLVLAHKNVTVQAITDKQLEDDRLVEVDWDGRIVWTGWPATTCRSWDSPSRRVRRCAAIRAGARSERAPTRCT